MNLEELWGETSIYGALNTMEVIERMIVCDGQVKRGFRESMFNPELKLCGVATAHHKEH